jgi:hypothetical protein
MKYQWKNVQHHKKLFILPFDTMHSDLWEISDPFPYGIAVDTENAVDTAILLHLYCMSTAKMQ